MDEAAGRASVTFQIVEPQKIKITDVEFIGATNFPQKELRKQIKTRAALDVFVDHRERGVQAG